MAEVVYLYSKQIGAWRLGSRARPGLRALQAAGACAAPGPLIFVVMTTTNGVINHFEFFFVRVGDASHDLLHVQHAAQHISCTYNGDPRAKHDILVRETNPDRWPKL